MASTLLSRIRQAASGTVGLAVQRFSSGATGDLQQWTNESGTPLASMSSSGQLALAADPTLSSQAARKSYVDNLVRTVRVTSTATLTLANLQTIDGVSLAAGDRVLYRHDITAANSGIWVVVDGGNWTRPTDFAVGSVIPNGTLIVVRQGTLNKGKVYALTRMTDTNDPITIGIHNLNYSTLLSDTMADAKGDILVGSAADTIVKFNPGSIGNNFALVTDSNSSTGLWASPFLNLTLLDNKGDMFAATGSDAVGKIPFATSNGQVLTSDSAQTVGNKWLIPGTGIITVVSLTDGATIATDAALGTHFRVAMSGDRTFSVPTNAVDGQRILYELTASSADRTPTFTTGSNGFAFGTDITSVGVIASGTTCYVGFIYNSAAARWRCLAVAKGF